METPQFLQNLPKQFEPLRAFLEGSLRPYIKIHEENVGHINEDSSNDPLTLWQSKIGGNPYFPRGLDYPTDPTTGEAMALLVQLNCADLPLIQGLDLPQQGILQFYMGGIQFADPAMDNSRICTLYFPEASQNRGDLITDFSFVNVMETIRGDYDDIYALTFSAEHDFFWLRVRGKNSNGLRI
ncbi:DUF1963 domain-containing protein [Leptolyngbya sp. AN02str]|uniref:DUF1963 domain-containing protein n=1 Tax=Leptolyngbya sp. AN02str TaxID=3423363 RepID=UPI003D317F3E